MQTSMDERRATLEALLQVWKSVGMCGAMWSFCCKATCFGALRPNPTPALDQLRLSADASHSHNVRHTPVLLYICRARATCLCFWRPSLSPAPWFCRQMNAPLHTPQILPPMGSLQEKNVIQTHTACCSPVPHRIRTDCSCIWRPKLFPAPWFCRQVNTPCYTDHLLPSCTPQDEDRLLTAANEVPSWEKLNESIARSKEVRQGCQAAPQWQYVPLHVPRDMPLDQQVLHTSHGVQLLQRVDGLQTLPSWPQAPSLPFHTR